MEDEEETMALAEDFDEDGREGEFRFQIFLISAL